MHDGLTYRFGDFQLDEKEQRLLRGGNPVATAPRTFALLSMLVRHPGELLAKDRLFDEVWRGVTVGDEALTQAIKDLRKLLGDDAAAPRFVETVPKRGYRFIAEVTTHPTGSSSDSIAPSRHPWDLALAGALGGAGAGLVGGAIYGLIAGAGNDAALPIFLVMLTITASVALLGALGVSLGMAAASRIAGAGWRFSIIGAAIGGFLVGEIFHRLASGSFSLLVGRVHDDFTAGPEGLLLGGAIAAGARLGAARNMRFAALGAAATGAAAGAIIAMLDGKLMAASLAALARDFHGSQLSLGLFGQLSAAGSWMNVPMAAAEGALLGAAMIAAIGYRARRYPEEIT